MFPRKRNLCPKDSPVAKHKSSTTDVKQMATDKILHYEQLLAFVKQDPIFFIF